MSRRFKLVRVLAIVMRRGGDPEMSKIRLKVNLNPLYKLLTLPRRPHVKADNLSTPPPPLVM